MKATELIRRRAAKLYLPDGGTVETIAATVEHLDNQILAELSTHTYHDDYRIVEIGIYHIAPTP